MSPRTGRPKTDKPLNKDVKVRFDEEGHEMLIEYCEKYNLTKTELIRRAVEEYLKNHQENRDSPTDQSRLNLYQTKESLHEIF